MSIRSSLASAVRRGILAACALLAASAHAGITFSLDRAQAAPGETVEVRAVFFNDTQTAADWVPPRQLVLQWRAESGQSLRSLAHLSGEAVPVSVPVNNFVNLSWRAVVPPGVTGLQAVAVEGQATLLALDTSPKEQGPVAGTPAAGPIVDAGTPGGAPGTGAPLPPAATAGLAAAPEAGISPNAAARGGSNYSAAAWEHFRNALSPLEPTYFVVGTRGGLHARFQLSLKYRLFQPPADRPAAFHENLYIGYTQNSFWDLDSPSKPFYDTTYNPSLFWQSDQLWQSPGARWSIGLAAGLEHQSNGRDGGESRSFNAVYAQPALNYRYGDGSTLSLQPRVRGYFGVAEENGDLARYLGHVDWRLRWARDDGIMISGTLRQGRGGRNAVQADLAWPLRRTWLANLNGYLHLQYVHGYGQTLLNYDTRQPDQFRIGLMLMR